MAHRYRQAADDKVLVHLYENLVEMRRQFMESLVKEVEGSRAMQLRGSIFVIDSLLRLPDTMVENGKLAETEIAERGLTDE